MPTALLQAWFLPQAVVPASAGAVVEPFAVPIVSFAASVVLVVASVVPVAALVVPVAALVVPVEMVERPAPVSASVRE